MIDWLRRASSVLHLRPPDDAERQRKARLIERVKRVSDAVVAETNQSLREKVADEYARLTLGRRP